MKFIAAILLLASVSAHAKVKKESWSCDVKGKKIVTAVFTETSSKATFHSDDEEQEKVDLTFHTATQKTALNKSQKTVLKGFLDAGYDSYGYKITLIRTIVSEFAYAGKNRGQALIETFAMPSCVEPALIYEVIDCEVEVAE
ncbi:MAG: hypothetical protein V4598_06155 [Bdellovibrionota bacterium]